MEAVTRTACTRSAALRTTLLITSVLTALLATLVPAGAVHASTASSAPGTQHALVATDARRDATAVRDSAIDLRRDVASLLQRYIDEYRPRFTPRELTQLEGYRSDADRQLASVVVTTSRLRTAIAQGRSARQVEAARRAALASWTRARAAANTSWDQARGIMEPKLSFLERLSALSDYNDMIGRFDRLGEEIRTVGP